MKTIEISDELYDRLKMCVVDPFDDTPDTVICRLIDIVDKGKSAWTSWDKPEESSPSDEVTVVQQKGDDWSSKGKDDPSWNKKVETTL